MKYEELKKRVRCANCGMIYDIVGYGDILPTTGKCPKCGSNAFDLVGKDANSVNIHKQYAKGLRSG